MYSWRATGVFWLPLYCALEEDFRVTVANARQVRAIPRRKTDRSDSRWLAYLLKSSFIKPLYIPEKKARDLREMTRLRVKLVQDRADYKDKCHKVLERCSIRLFSKLLNMFEKRALGIVGALMQGGRVDEAIEKSPRLRRKKGQ